MLYITQHKRTYLDTVEKKCIEETSDVGLETDFLRSWSRT